MAAAWETAATQSISRPCKYIDNDTDICNNVVSMLATTAAKEENDDDSMNAKKKLINNNKLHAQTGMFRI